MKIKFLSTITIIVFAISSTSLVYALNENVDPDIDNINENNSQLSTIVTITNETQTLKESPVTPYEKICPENTDWPEAPNKCDMRTNYTRTELKILYDEYYQYKGEQWMEMKKTEMDSVISKGSWIWGYPALWLWLGHTQQELPFENINVYLYYSLNGQAPDVGWGWYYVNDEFEPVITSYYISPGAIIMISSSIAIGAASGGFFSFKKIILRPKRKRITAIGFVLLFVGASMYFIGILGFTQSQIDQRDEDEFLPVISYIMFLLAGIPIALSSIPVIVHGFIWRFSIGMTLFASSGLIVTWIMFFISRLN